MDLNPPGFSNTVGAGIRGGKQVGSGVGTATGNNNHALLWSGTAASFVDLNLSGFTSSIANVIDGGQQAGYGSGTPTGNNNHALIWSGTAASAVDINPAGFTTSFIGGGENGRFVGTGNGTATGNKDHALLWSDGTAASVVDLNPFLPPGFVDSRAADIDAAGNVVGYGTDGSGKVHAFLWAVPEPGSLSLLFVAVVGSLTRRCRVPRRTRD